jgi:ABC-2 type transport system ATP-binding protein
VSESIVEVEHLTHTYGAGAPGRTALDDVSLAVRPGEIFGFLGPNGSGKTTLFRILSTLIPPRQGRVRMLGMELPQDQAAIRQRIGVVFQAPSLDKQLTAEENLVHHGHLYGLRGTELKQRIDALLEKFGLTDRRGERVAQLSGGMRRRVELAKGLLHRPQVLLLDEPSTGLDPTARIDLWGHLKQIQSADGVTVLLTTHLMDEADRCDRLTILDKGRVVACDAPDALKASIGGDVITLQTSDPAQVAQNLRQSLSIEATQLDGLVRLEHPRGHELVPQIIEALPRGIVNSVSVGKPTLEDVFVRLTGHVFKTEAT